MTNLDGRHSSQESLNILKGQIGTGKLVSYKLPDVLKQCSICNIRPVDALARTRSEKPDELASGRNDESPRVARTRERPCLLALVGQNGEFEGIQGATNEVLAHKGHEAREAADGGVGRETAFDDASNVVPIGVLDILGGEYSAKREKTVLGIFEVGGYVDPFVHETLEVALPVFGSCKGDHINANSKNRRKEKSTSTHRD